MVFSSERATGGAAGVVLDGYSGALGCPGVLLSRCGEPGTTLAGVLAQINGDQGIEYALMAGYKEPGFQDRVKAAGEARAKALAKLKSKPPVDPAVLAERAARAAEREAAQAAKREAARLAKLEAEAKAVEAELQAAIERERAEEEARAAAPPPPPPPLTDEERKAIRDAKYAARKARRK